MGKKKSIETDSVANLIEMAEAGKFAPEKYSSNEHALISKALTNRILKLHEMSIAAGPANVEAVREMDDLYRAVKDVILDKHIFYVKDILTHKLRILIGNYPIKHARPALMCEIVTESGLSLDTVTETLDEIANSGSNHLDIATNKILADDLKGRLLVEAVKATDVKDMVTAARLYMQATGAIEQNNGKTIYNNFIQINGLTITQQDIATLPTEKQLQIAEIIGDNFIPIQHRQIIPLADAKKA